MFYASGASAITDSTIVLILICVSSESSRRLYLLSIDSRKPVNSTDRNEGVSVKIMANRIDNCDVGPCE